MSNETRFVYRRPKWGRGMITEEDARFLHDLLLEVRPSVAIELGVASGCSSVVILEAMRQCREPRTANPEPRTANLGSRIPNPESRTSNPVWLHAFDISARCYFDPSHPTGDAVAELTPWNVQHYRFTAGDVLCARERLTGLNAPLAFIDANHLHPWATADLDRVAGDAGARGVGGASRYPLALRSRTDRHARTRSEAPLRDVAAGETAGGHRRQHRRDSTAGKRE